MLRVEYTGQFKKDYKLAVKRNYDIDELVNVINMLANEEKLPEKFRDHALVNYSKNANVRECHIKPDWLLIYRAYHDKLILELLRTGTHSDLF
ncbi:MAG: type II toxin-antitoxin system YafQ family toxin [Eubacterium sp.]|nr:type II toxin-antitoxin system YafQ family toxin [Eubacterium sp.]